MVSLVWLAGGIYMHLEIVELNVSTLSICPALVAPVLSQPFTSVE